ncbi:AAA family ATPase [Myroides sp. LJL119]
MQDQISNQENLQFTSRVDLKNLQQSVQKIRDEIQKVIVGQELITDQIIVALLTGGHILLEGVPGVAKTLIAKLLAKCITIDFSRIQFTPDLMPSDILGTSIFNQKNNEFEFKKGPIFSNMVLIDEINRAPAKTQSALFEVMEERQITIDSKNYTLEKPFIVIATQNPIEQEGTYSLPEAQLDRFLFKIQVGYPTLSQEIELLNKEHSLENQNKLDLVNGVLTQQELIEYQRIIKQIIIEPHLIQYIAQIVGATRDNSLLYLGASPRASIAILNASKGFAAIDNRDFVTPEDIKQAAIPVLSHRVSLAPEREMEGIKQNQVITQIIDSIEIPR